MLRQNLLWHSSLLTELIQKQEAFSSLCSASPRLGCQGVSLWCLWFGSNHGCPTPPDHHSHPSDHPAAEQHRVPMMGYWPPLPFLGLILGPALLSRAKCRWKKLWQKGALLELVQSKSPSFSLLNGKGCSRRTWSKGSWSPWWLTAKLRLLLALLPVHTPIHQPKVNEGDVWEPLLQYTGLLAKQLLLAKPTALGQSAEARAVLRWELC